MPIKNYRSSVPASRSIEELQSALVKHGASGILFEYEQGTQRISALQFKLPMKRGSATFSLPAEWRRFQAVLKEQRVPKYRDEEYVYRVAWRNLRDWVLSQLALYETRMVDLPQVFLPFVSGKNGQTLYQMVESGGFLLGDGNDRAA